MNQILSTGGQKGKKQRTKRGSGNGIDIKKIIVFFVCAIALFGSIVAGVGVYQMYTRGQSARNHTPPTVDISQLNNGVSIRAQYSGGIDKIIYYWTEEDKNEEPRNGGVDFQKLIDIPSGMSTLTVQLIDMQGNVTTFTENFIGIAINVSEDGMNIEVIVTKEDGLEYVTYQLNDEEETRIEADPEYPYIIEFVLYIADLNLERGDNIITVTAVDVNSYVRVETQTVQGHNAPVITVERRGDYLDARVVHDMGFERIIVTLNDQEAIFDEDDPRYDPELTIFQMSIRLRDGLNTLVIRAYSLEGTVEEFRARAER